MYYYVLVLALSVVGAYANIPNYLGAYSNHIKASKLLTLLLSFDSPTAENRSYAVLKNVISGLAELELFLNVNYDDIYIAGALIGAAVGHESPKLVQHLAKNRNDLAMWKTKEVRRLIEIKYSLDEKRKKDKSIFICYHETEKESDPVKCNEEVHKILLKNPQLYQESFLLLALGEVGRYYLKQEPEFYEVAQKQNEIQYLLHDGREKLRLIVEKTLAAYKQLYRVLYKSSK